MSQAGGKIYGEMFCEALANAVAQGGGIGIAKLVEGSFEKARAVGAGRGRRAQRRRANSCSSRSTKLTPTNPDATKCDARGFERIRRAQGSRSTASHRFHTGVDVAAQEGSPILAAAPGVVLRAGRRGGYGNAMEIDNGSGI